MPEPTWTRVEAPILAAIADFKPRVGKPGMWSTDIPDETGLEYGEITTALRRLEAAGYVTGQRLTKGADVTFVGLQLTEKGLRASGVWPSDDPFEDLVRVLEEHIAKEPDEEKVGRLRRLLSAVRDVGRDLGVGVLTEVFTRQLPR
jgi:DNA-binding MarR family transcriptional regulator